MSEKPKRKNPYEQLRDAVHLQLRKWVHRREHVLFAFAKPVRTENESIPYAQLFDAVDAAQKLGMRVTVEVVTDGLKVVARQRVDAIDMPNVYVPGEIK